MEIEFGNKNFHNEVIKQLGKVTLGYSFSMMRLETSPHFISSRRRRTYTSDKERLWLVQKGICKWCNKNCIRNGTGGTKNEFTVDHVIPLSAGGTNHWMNLVGSCHAYNNKRAQDWRDVHIVKFDKNKEGIKEMSRYSLNEYELWEGLKSLGIKALFSQIEVEKLNAKPSKPNWVWKPIGDTKYKVEETRPIKPLKFWWFVSVIIGGCYGIALLLFLSYLATVSVKQAFMISFVPTTYALIIGFPIIIAGKFICKWFGKSSLK